MVDRRVYKPKSRPENQRAARIDPGGLIREAICSVLSLRQYYLGQVQTVGGDNGRPLSLVYPSSRQTIGLTIAMYRARKLNIGPNGKSNARLYGSLNCWTVTALASVKLFRPCAERIMRVTKAHRNLVANRDHLVLAVIRSHKVA